MWRLGTSLSRRVFGDSFCVAALVPRGLGPHGASSKASLSRGILSKWARQHGSPAPSSNNNSSSSSSSSSSSTGASSVIAPPPSSTSAAFARRFSWLAQSRLQTPTSLLNSSCTSATGSSAVAGGFGLFPRLQAPSPLHHLHPPSFSVRMPSEIVYGHKPTAPVLRWSSAHVSARMSGSGGSSASAPTPAASRAWRFRRGNQHSVVFREFSTSSSSSSPSSPPSGAASDAAKSSSADATNVERSDLVCSHLLSL